MISTLQLERADERNVRRLAAFLNVDPTLPRVTLINCVAAAMWFAGEEDRCHGASSRTVNDSRPQDGAQSRDTATPCD